MSTGSTSTGADDRCPGSDSGPGLERTRTANSSPPRRRWGGGGRRDPVETSAKVIVIRIAAPRRRSARIAAFYARPPLGRRTPGSFALRRPRSSRSCVNGAANHLLLSRSGTTQSGRQRAGERLQQGIHLPLVARAIVADERAASSRLPPPAESRPIRRPSDTPCNDASRGACPGLMWSRYRVKVNSRVRMSLRRSASVTPMARTTSRCRPSQEG
jgi:hypothetical protein